MDTIAQPTTRRVGINEQVMERNNGWNGHPSRGHISGTVKQVETEATR